MSTTGPTALNGGAEESKRKMEDAAVAGSEKSIKLDADSSPKTAPIKTKVAEDDKVKKQRQIRLEQNRKAARESRRRKKVMIEELQRSVIFFSRANQTLKSQNDDLTRLMVQAQMQIAAIESHKKNESAANEGAAPVAKTEEAVQAQDPMKTEQAQHNAVATQAAFESKGFPSAAARSAAQAMNGTAGEQVNNNAAAPATLPPHPPLPQMQPGATMQAMANFQQAAAAAMQMAMGQMQNVPGMNVQQLHAAPTGANAQQAYT